MTPPRLSDDAAAARRLSRLDLLDLGASDRAGLEPSAVALAAAPLALAAAATVYFGDALEPWSGLVWAVALVPVFLLARREGWRAAAVGLGAGMVAMLGVEVVGQAATGFGVRSWLFAFTAAVLTVAALGAGWLSERLVALRQETLEEALEVALEDPETGLPTRRAAELFVRKEFAAAQRGEALAVVLFDLDGFQEFVERYGKDTARELLRTVGEVFRETSRRADLVGRWGSQEFLTVLPGEHPEGAGTFAERVRTKADGLEFGLAGGSVSTSGITVSAGVAAFEEGMDESEQLLELSHRALHAAKAKGGDSVVLFDHEAHGSAAGVVASSSS